MEAEYVQVLPESGKQSLTPLKPALLPWPAGLSHPIAPRLIPFPLLLRHAPITLVFLSSSDTNRPSSLQPKGPCRDALCRHRGEAAPWMERASAFTSPPRQPSLAAPSLNTVSNTPFQVLHSTCLGHLFPCLWSITPTGIDAPRLQRASLSGSPVAPQCPEWCLVFRKHLSNE